MVDSAQRSGIEITIRDSGASAAAKVIKRSLDDVDRSAKRAGSGVGDLESSLQTSRGTLGAVETALVRVRSPLDTLKAQFLAGEAAAAKFRNGLTSTGATVTAFGRRVGTAGTRLTDIVSARLLTAGGALLKFAAEATESENRFNVAMGEMADQGRAFSEGLRAELGLNAFAIRGQLATIQTMATGMGFTEKAAFDLSSQITLLSQDLASFPNLSVEEVFKGLGAGIDGEIEPLKRLGIFIDETTIKQAALRRGLIEAGETMSQQQKVIARFITILEQTTDAQGALGRTLDSPSNQLRIMGDRAKNAAIELGTALLPVATAVLKVMSLLAQQVAGGVRAFNELSPEVKTLAVVLALVAAAAGPVLKLIGLLTVAVGALATAIGVLVAPVGLVSAAFTVLAGSIAAVIASLDELQNAESLGDVFDIIKNKAISVKDSVVDFFFGQSEAAGTTATEIEDIYAGLTSNLEAEFKRLSEAAGGGSADAGDAAIALLQTQVNSQRLLLKAQGEGAEAIDKTNDSIETYNFLLAKKIKLDSDDARIVGDLIEERNALRRATDELAESQRRAVTAQEEASRKAVDAARKAQEAAAEAAKSVREEFRDAFDDATDNLKEFIITGEGSFEDFLESIRRKLVNKAFDQIGFALENAIFGGLGGNASGGGASLAGATIFSGLSANATTASNALAQTTAAANQNAQATQTASSVLGGTFITALTFAASGLAALFGGGGGLSKTGQILSTVVGVAGSLAGSFASGGFSFGGGSGVSTTGMGAGSPFGSGVGSGVGGAPALPVPSRIPFPNRVPRFATGGSLTVPGFGPADSRAFFGANVAGPPVVARVSPGERITFTPRGGNDGGETDELLRDVRSLLMQIAGSTRSTERALAAQPSGRGFNQDGFSSAADAGVLIQSAVARNK